MSVEVAKPKQEFKCTICSKSFSKKSSVAEHISLVHGKTPFKCSICNVGFSRKSSLTSHIAQDHEGKKENVDNVFARSERTKQMEQILNFQVPAEGLELVILLHTQYLVLSTKI